MRDAVVNREKKRNGLIVIIVAYIAAFAIGAVPFALTEDLLAAEALFTATATLVIYIVSAVCKDTSVYDPYWSVAPPVMLLAGMLKYHLWSANAVLLLIVTLIWSVRLTGNWYATYKGLGREDWRYAMYRKKLGRAAFEFVNFFGLHFMPTAVVYAGLVNGLFIIGESDFTSGIISGLIIMLAGTALEYIADRSVHRFLEEHRGENVTCNISVWRYSRHPNYLGEMLFWTGMYIAFLGVCPGKWYCGAGFLLIIGLFLFISIPMMEKHNMERRPDYPEYRKATSMLLLLPPKKELR